MKGHFSSFLYWIIFSVLFACTRFLEMGFLIELGPDILVVTFQAHIKRGKEVFLE